MAYYQFKDENDESYGSFETAVNAFGEWYWQACFSGCLPDGEFIGPFKTEADAVFDAQYN